MSRRLSVWLLGLMLIAANFAFGQATASSSLQGTVTDATGAAVVGAEVTITNAATGVTRTVKSGSDGSYRVDPLPVGIYNVKVAMGGFTTETVNKVETYVGASTTQSFSLKVGTKTESVEVTAEAPLLDSLKTDVSQNITPRQVQDLPLIGRDVADLAYLAPGVKAADSYDPTKNRYAILSVNGQGGRNVNVTVNGVDNKDNTVGGPVMQLPLEAVQEFQIATQRFSAQNGRSEGAAINMITKSGSNNYHGSGFGFFREQTFDADQVKPSGINDGKFVHSHPDYSRQFFGGSVGGPFVKDKLFGFFGIERQREHQGLGEDSNSLTQLQAVTSLGAQPAAELPRPFFETRYSGRADYVINSKHTAYLSYSSQGNDSLNDQSDGTGDLSNGNFTVNHMQIANLTVNSVFSPTLLNSFTVGYQYWNNLIDSTIRKPLVTFPSASFGTNTNVPQQSFQRKWQFRDDVSKTIGNHNLKFGEDYIFNPTLGGYFEFSSTLEIDFNTDPTDILANKTLYPQGFATPGLISGMTIANGDPATNVAGGTKQLGLYFQDDWKATSRLTLNLGVRWDKDYNMVGGSAVRNSRTFQEMVAAAAFSPLAKQFTYQQAGDDNKDFSPRIGFAYDLTGASKHVLRGGYGLYYGDVFQNIPIFMEQQHNPTIFQTLFSLSDTDVVPGTGIPLNQWRYGVDPMPTIAPPSSQLVAGSTGRLIDPTYRNPVTEEMNVGYSWQLNPSSVIEAEYVHVLGLHENKTININPKLPASGTATGFSRPLAGAFASAGVPVLASVRDEQSIGRSRYDGMNIGFRQRMSHHFSLNANYTLAQAQSYDGGGGTFRNYPRDPRFPFAAQEYGPNVNDERHHVTMSGLVDLPWGLQFSPIIQGGSSRPYNAVNSNDDLGFGTGDQKAVVVPVSDPTNFSYVSTVGQLAARQCYFVTKQCTIAKYDPLRGDPFFQMDARLAKNIKLGEQRNLQLVFQAFDLTNRANYGNNFGGDITAPNSFRQAQGFINPSSTIAARSFTGEFGARFTF